MNTTALDSMHAFQMMADRAREDAIRSARVSYAAVGVALGVAAAVAVVMGLTERAPMSGMLSGAAVACLMSALCIRLSSALQRPVELAQTGLPATVTFERVVGGGINLQVSNASMRGNVAQTRMRMQVAVDGRAPYAAEVTDFLPSGAYGRLVAGTRFAARVDPRRPDRVLVDWTAKV